jgi:hypothetical protein
MASPSIRPRIIFGPGCAPAKTLGLFQGCSGFSKRILLIEDGVEPFCNTVGVQHPFAKGNLKETLEKLSQRSGENYGSQRGVRSSPTVMRQIE